MAEKQAINQSWRGTFQLPVDAVRFWRVGPLALWIQHLAGEWRFAWKNASAPLETALEVDKPAEESDLLAFENIRRIAGTAKSDTICINAALPNRPIVTRPEKPFSIPAGDKATIYLTTPIWLGISPAKSAKPWMELPTYRPSDTWFGPPNSEGELCYASRTHCRLNIDELIGCPHRVATAVTIKNEAETALPVDRLKLPVPHLSLYEATDGGLWTQEIVFTRSDERDDFAIVSLKPKPPGTMKKAVLISKPRSASEPHGVSRVFSSIFSLE